jgi:hypothetical protein
MWYLCLVQVFPPNLPEVSELESYHQVTYASHENNIICCFNNIDDIYLRGISYNLSLT